MKKANKIIFNFIKKEINFLFKMVLINFSEQ